MTPPIKVSVPEKALLDALARVLGEFKAKIEESIATETAAARQAAGESVVKTESLESRLTLMASMWSSLEDHFHGFRIESGRRLTEIDDRIASDGRSLDTRFATVLQEIHDSTESLGRKLEESDLDDLRKDVVDLTNETKNLWSTIAEHESSIAEEKHDSKGRHRALVEGIDQIAGKLTEFELRFNAAMEEEVVAKDDILEQARAGLKTELSELAQKIARAWQTINPLKGRLETLESERDRLDEIDRNLADAMDGLERDIMGLVSEHKERIDNLFHEGEIANGRIHIVEGKTEALQRSTAQLGDNLVGLAATVGETRNALEEGLRGLGESLDESRAIVEEMPAKIDDALAPAFHELERNLVAEEGRRELWERAYFTTVDWAPSDTGYQEGGAVRHRNGLWRARRPTFGEPGESDDWIQLSGSVVDAWVEREGYAKARLRLEETGGDSLRTPSFSLPAPRPRGIFSPSEAYDEGDQVSHRGTLYQALCDRPRGEPASDNEDWALLVKRGPRGARGPRGEPGEVPPLGDFVKSWMDFLDIGADVPILRFGGLWRYGMAMRYGSIYYHDGALYIALRDVERAEIPPSSPIAGGDDMAVVYPKPGGGGGGGGLSANICEVRGQTGFFVVPAATGGEVQAANPKLLRIDFSAPVEISSEASAPFGMVVEIDSTPVVVEAAERLQSGNGLEVTVDTAVQTGETVTWEYVLPDPPAILRAAEDCHNKSVPSRAQITLANSV